MVLKKKKKKVVETIAPQLCHNTKNEFKIAKKMCKRVQAKKGEVLTTLGMLEDYKKRPRHSKQKKKKKEKLGWYSLQH